MIPSRQLNSGKPVRVILNYRELLLVVDQRKAWEKDVQTETKLEHHNMGVKGKSAPKICDWTWLPQAALRTL